jgi:hypothetical protein
MKLASKNVSLKSILGQNTAEYLIMLTLVAIGSIGLMTAFGKTIQSKLAYVSSAISGDVGNYTAAQSQTKKAAEKANKKASTVGNIKMEGIDKTELQDN